MFFFFCVNCFFSQDAASPRYIFTALQKSARAVFHPDDDALLTYLDDDGLSIEPEFYVPVIPLILVNGSDGIGTGWSSQVTCRYPTEFMLEEARGRGGEAAYIFFVIFSFLGRITLCSKFHTSKYIFKTLVACTPVHIHQVPWYISSYFLYIVAGLYVFSLVSIFDLYDLFFLCVCLCWSCKIAVHKVCFYLLWFFFFVLGRCPTIRPGT